MSFLHCGGGERGVASCIVKLCWCIEIQRFQIYFYSHKIVIVRRLNVEKVNF